MKKVLAMLLTLAMAVSFCVPSFAAPSPEEIIATIKAAVETVKSTVQGAIDQINQTIDSVPEAPSKDNEEAYADFELGCAVWANARLGWATTDEDGDGQPDRDESGNVKYIPSESGEKTMSIDSLRASVQVLVNQGKLSADQQAAIEKALKTATPPSQPSITLPESITNLVLADTPQELVDAMTALKFPLQAMKPALKLLATAKLIKNDPALVDGANALIDTLLNETGEDSKNAGGIKGFISGIVDKVKGALGKGGDGDGANAGANDASNAENGMQDPTGDVAIYSVLGVAAVAGVALVLTRKKKSN